MPRAVILTALSVEFLAVRTHLTDLQEAIHPQGTIYERGKFAVDGQIWEVGIVEIGAGNPGAAWEAERAITHFSPDVILFVGIAGGIKDVALGDVVASTKVYGYESGRAGETFRPRPEVGLSAYGLEQRARAEARKSDWLRRLSLVPSPEPRVFVAPIAAGEKIVALIESEVFQFLRSNYGDAIAVEMEGIGFLDAARANQQVSALVIRGISDLIDGNNDDLVEREQIRQEKAANHASAFAFEILAKYRQSNSNHQWRWLWRWMSWAGVALAVMLAIIYIQHPPISLPSSPPFISWGEKRLISIDKLPHCASTLNQPRSEREAIQACNDPEGWIHLNNAEAVQSQKPIRLVISVAGHEKKLGPEDSLEMLRGVVLAQNEINQLGGINGRKLLIGIADDKENPSDAEAIAHFLVEHSDDVWGSIGHGSSKTTAAAGKVYDQNLVTISPTSTAIRKSTEYPDGLPLSPYVFRTASNDSVAAQALVDYIGQDYKRAAIVYTSEDPYSQSLRQAFQAKFKAKEGQVVDSDNMCNLSDKAFTAEQCLKASANAQVLLLIPSESEHVQGIIDRNAQQKTKLHLLGGDTMYTNSILNLDGSQGMVVAIPWYRNNYEFERKAKQLFDTGNVNWRSAMTYDATQAFRKGLEIALAEGCETGSTSCRKKLQEVLLREGFAADGVLGEGTVRFDSLGDRSLVGLEGKLGVLVQVKSLDSNSSNQERRLSFQPINSRTH